jgi:outer membrane protein assembly factor BamB
MVFMFPAERFVSFLEEKDLLPAEVIAALRHQVQKSTRAADAEAIAQLLVRQGHLTRSMADRLLAQARESHGQTAADKPSTPPTSGDSEELTFAPDRPAKQPELRPAPPPAAAAAGPAAPTPAKPKPPAAADKKPAAAPAAPFGGLKPLDSLLSSELLPGEDGFSSLDGGGALSAPRPKKFSLRRFLRNLLRRKKSRTITVKAADPRQVKLLLISWSIAILTLATVFIAFFYFTSAKPQDLLQDAKVAFDMGKYPEAIDRYNRFLANFSYLPDAHPARVRLGLARLHQAALDADKAKDWSAAFSLAQELMQTLPKEDGYAESRGEIALALAVIAEGLAKQSQESATPQLVEHAQMVVGLIELNVPEISQPREKLAAITRILSGSERQVDSGHDLQQTILAIQEAVAKGDAKTAFTQRNRLVREYPELVDERRLEEALVPAVEILKTAVKVVARRLAPSAAQPPGPIEASTALAVPIDRGEVPGNAGQVVFAYVDGIAAGLDAATGKPLWQRRMGTPAKPGLMPPPMRLPGESADSAADVLLTDPSRREIVRVEGRTGRLVWRLTPDAPLAAEPVLAGNRLVVPTDDCRLLLVDPATGESHQSVELPSPVHVSPVIDAKRGLLFQVADGSTLFVISLADLTCHRVFQVGHEPGTIVIPPVLLGDFLLLGVNTSATEAALRVVSIDPMKAVQQIRMKDQFKTPLLPDRNRVLLVTARGGVRLLAIGTSEANPVETVATLTLADEEPRQRFCLAQGEGFWIADNRLCRYTTGDQGIVPEQATDAGQEFVQPPVIFGETMYHVRQKPGLPGATVSAADLENHSAVWQTWIGAPLAGEPVADAAGKLMVVTASGGLFRLDPAEFRGHRVVDEPLLAIEAPKLQQPIRHVIPLADGMLAMSGGAGAKDIALYDPAEQQRASRFRWLIAPDKMACAPVAYRGGVLASCPDGRVVLLDPQSSGNMASPFVPDLKYVTAWTWRPPAVADSGEAILCDGDRRFYVVGVEKRAQPALVGSAAVKSEQSIASATAAVGRVVYVVDATNTLLSFELPRLTPGAKHQLAGHCVWGPCPAGRHVLLATDKNRLYAFDDQQQLAWETATDGGLPVGHPLVAGSDYWLASQSGVMLRIGAADGKVAAKIDTGCPLCTGPMLLGGRLFVGGSDGSVNEVQFSQNARKP